MWTMDAVILLTPDERAVMEYVETVNRAKLAVPRLLAESLERVKAAEDGADALAEENRWILALAARFYQQRDDVVE
jgi:hypothetical protein